MPRAPRRRRPRSPARSRSTAPAPPRRDHRHAAEISRISGDQLEVEALLGAVGVDRVDQQLARAALDRLARPGEGVQVGLGAAAVGGHDEARLACAALRLTSSESTSTCAPNRSAISSISAGRAIAAQFTPILSAPTGQQPGDVVGGAHSAADGQRDEDLLGGAPHHVVRGRAVVDGRGDVEEGELVGALLVVPRGELDRVARVAQVQEVDALDDAAGGDVQARDDAARRASSSDPRGVDRADEDRARAERVQLVHDVVASVARAP